MRAAILTATAERQSETIPTAGRWYIRGGRTCYVASAERGALEWVYDDGTRESGSADDFRARALDEVSFGAGRAVSYLDGAWQIAGARGVGAVTRQLALGLALQRAPTNAEGAEVAAWILALANGREPTRKT